MSRGRTAVVWDPRFREYDFGPNHPFSETSRELAVRLLRSSIEPADSDGFEWIDTVPPGDDLLPRFHGARYLDLVRRADESGDPPVLDRGDTPSFRGCFSAAARLASGADRAVRHALERSAPAFHPAGGFHHAGPGSASGFCIFNDVGVGIAGALAAGRRVAYIDIDAHHGDGVMYGFYGSGRLLDIDFHQDGRTLFPGTGFPSETGRGDGAGLKVNLPLPPGAGDDALLPLFRRIVPPLLDAFRPELIVLQHGVDGHVGDPLTRLQYTPAAYLDVLRNLLALAGSLADGRLVVVGGGGYRPETVSRVLARAGRVLGGLTVPAADTALPGPWRVAYRGEIGSEAPEAWEDPTRLARTPWREEDEEALVAELERNLGRRFPQVRASRTAR
jgi:acetoin utilization protein AcuC